MAQDTFRASPLKSPITRLRPMTGIVLWDDSDHKQTVVIRLEYPDVPYADLKHAGRAA